jgi:hypothetical protein
MDRFAHKYNQKLLGLISGFDRLVLKGTLRPLSYPAGMMNFLFEKQVLLKEFAAYALEVTQRVKEASQQQATQLGRPIQYVACSDTRKEPMARRILQREKIQQGLICVLKSVEPCISYDVWRNRQKKILQLRRSKRKCLWVYQYWMDSQWGLMSARIQTWFPFDIYVCLNGREWLARQMDRFAMQYRRGDNCFLWIEDLHRAQRLMQEQLQFRWLSALKRLARRLNPVHRQIFRGLPIEYYWTVYQSEWATDLLFRSAGDLAQLYPRLVQGAMESFSSPEVMRFLGKKLHGNFAGELLSDYRERREGVRVKHRIGANSLKMYDKQGSVLRVETTVNDPSVFRVFRTLQGDESGQKAWRPLLRGIANMGRLAQVSQACNRRYLDALATLDSDTPIQNLVHRICRPVHSNGQRVRALRPWSPEDQRLLQSINRGEFALNGLRNRDLLPHLYPEASSLPAQERGRYSARVTRKLRMLRAHGIIRKVTGTHRYVFTTSGREIVTGILQYQQLTLAQLQKASA